MTNTYNLINHLEIYPDLLSDDIEIEDYKKISVDKLPSLGLAAESIKPFFQYALNSKDTITGLYKVTIPSGGHLASFKDGSGFLGTVLNGDNVLSGQARLNPVQCDPAMLMIAVAFMNLEKKLDDIKETQQDILDFLQQKEKAELKGNLTLLMEILKNYKYTCLDTDLRIGNYNKILDIKQKALQNITFSKVQIRKAIEKRKLVIHDGEIKKLVDNLNLLFENYQISLYTYAFSTFMEILYAKDHNTEYLEGVKKSINKYSMEYRELYTECYSKAEANADKSLQTLLLKGLGYTSKYLGETMSKLSFAEKTAIDDNLIKTGSKLLEEDRTNKLLEKLLLRQSSLIQPFEDGIEVVKRVYNQPMDILFDRENVYVPNVLN